MAVASRLEVLLQRKRAQHRELRGPATLAGLERVCRRESVVVTDSAMMKTMGLAFAIAGRASIMLHSRLPARARLPVLAHELAHTWMHVHDAGNRKLHLTVGSPEFTAAEARCELEADAVAAALLFTPAAEYRAALKAMSEEFWAIEAERAQRKGTR